MKNGKKGSQSSTNGSHNNKSPNGKTPATTPSTTAKSTKSSAPSLTVMLLSSIVVCIAIGVSYYITKLRDDGLSSASIINNDQTTTTTTTPKRDNVCFLLAPNGNGTVEGIPLCSKDFKEVDDVIEKYCAELSVNNPSMGKGKVKFDQCRRGSGARLITHSGVRVLDMNRDILDDERVYLVPQGLHFLWPLVKIGNVIVPRNIVSPVTGKPIRLVELSNQPRVFKVENFVNDEEVADILEKNKPRMTPSEVGFAGWKDSTRTSSTSWDMFSKSARHVQRRTFDILGMDFQSEMADAVQVLRYEKSQWYKPHTDYFDSKGYDNNDPTENNGTNRFATMFLYLSSVNNGGHTVFPHSTSHEGYNGEKLVHDGTIDTPSYIDAKDAVYCCNVSSTALRSTPIKGNAVLFYSQLADGSLDPYSLHGGCPPTTDEEKWSANVWVWNRPKPDKSKAKDKPPAGQAVSNSNQLEVLFINDMNMKVKLVWDPTFGAEPEDGTDPLSVYVAQAELEPGRAMAINTFIGHTFHAIVGNEKKFTYIATKYDQDKRISMKW